MKKILCCILLLVFVLCGKAQQDTSLINRLYAILSLTQVKDFEKIMDYTYPKLFGIVPRDLMITTMQNSFETDEFTIELDSIKIDNIYPIFKINDTSYVKVKHTMLMKMKYTEPFDTTDKESTEFLVNLMEAKFGKGNVRFDAVANSLNIFMKPDIVGIKENNSSPWTFITLNEDAPAMLEMLLNKAVLDKLKEYK